MWTRTSDRWSSKPGAWDRLNMRYIYPSSNKYGIPDLKAPTIRELPEPPTCLIPYNIRVRSQLGYADAAIHFFIDDYRFELAWSNPEQAFQRISKAWLALTPDFSLYTDFPMTAQLWNTYRNRWCGAFWQSRGLVVIPSVSWSDESSYDFCFEGIQHGSPVAISTQGIKWDNATNKNFISGYDEMISRINPRFIVCYGKMDDELRFKHPDTLVKTYPTYWENLKKARKAGQQDKFFTGELEAHTQLEID